MTIINGRIKTWDKNPSNSGMNCILESGKLFFAPPDKIWLAEKYPIGTAVEITHNQGTIKIMKPMNDDAQVSAAAVPATTQPAAATAPAKSKPDDLVKKTGVVKTDVPTKEETARKAAESGFHPATEDNEVVKVADAKKKAIADAATAKEKAQAEARQKDNEEHARQLAGEQKGKETPKQPNAPAKVGGSAAVSTQPALIPATGQKPTETPISKSSTIVPGGMVLTPFGLMPKETWDLVQKGMIPIDETTLQVEVEFSLQIDRFRPLRVKMFGQGRERVTKMFTEQLETMINIVVPISQRFPRFD